MCESHRVGLISWDFALRKGGMGRSLAWIASALREGGIVVRVGSPVVGDTERALLPVTRCIGGHLLFSLLLPPVLRRWIARNGVNRLLLPVGPGGVLLWGRPPMPFDAVVYHTYLQQWRAVPGQRWKRVFVPLERRMLRRAERIFCFCEDTARVLRENMGIAGEKVRVLPHAVAWKGEGCEGGQESKKREKGQKGLCVCIARLEERKGVRVLLKAWKIVVQHVPDARLVIVGRGKQARCIDRLIATVGPSVRRVPHLPQTELQALVLQAAIALCPAYLEGFGLAAAEAMAAGTAVIASDVDGLRSLIVHEHTGLLVPAGDAPSLSAAIVRLLFDDALRDRLAHASFEEARIRFDASRSARALVASYDSCTIAA